MKKGQKDDLLVDQTCFSPRCNGRRTAKDRADFTDLTQLRVKGLNGSEPEDKTLRHVIIIVTVVMSAQL